MTRKQRWLVGSVGLFVTLGGLLGAAFIQPPPGQRPQGQPSAPKPAPAAGSETAKPGSQAVFFAFWNVENLFDDKDDRRNNVDETFDNPFALDARLRQEKLSRLAEVILKMNQGRGPDILACVEVESVRAADLLRNELNQRLEAAKAEPGLKYTQVVMKNLDAGRHIAPAIITRLPVVHAATKLHGRDLRILEARLVVQGQELIVLASHWTSQIRQEDGGRGDAGRQKYADTLFDVFQQAAQKDPLADLLICGDFNDPPEAKSVYGRLGAVPLSERDRVVPTRQEPLLLNLLGGRDPARFGTIWYDNRPLIYDQICVSPGLLNSAGWLAIPETTRVISEGLYRGPQRDPWRFGNPNSPPVGGRGYSDHFPVTVQLLVQPAAKP